MRISWSRVRTIARREYLTTIRRKAFVFTIVGLPALYTFLMFIMIKPQVGEAMRAIRNFHALGVVDSTGLLSGAPREISTSLAPEGNPFSRPAPGAAAPALQSVNVTVRFYPDQAAAEAALRSGAVDQMLIVPAD
jgi:ABC-type Na+ efflux pump permease subunit